MSDRRLTFEQWDRAFTKLTSKPNAERDYLRRCWEVIRAEQYPDKFAHPFNIGGIVGPIRAVA